MDVHIPANVCACVCTVNCKLVLFLSIHRRYIEHTRKYTTSDISSFKTYIIVGFFFCHVSTYRYNKSDEDTWGPASQARENIAGRLCRENESQNQQHETQRKD